jgi:hypothetical protein
VNPISYLQSAKNFPLREVAPLSVQARDAVFTLGKYVADGWALKNKTGNEEFDLYSPPTSFWNQEVQNYPGKKSVQTGHEIMEIARHKDYRQLYYDLPFLSLCGVGLDVVGESMLATLLNRFTLFDEFEVFLKRDQDALKKGYLVGHTNYEAERLLRIVPEKYEAKYGRLNGDEQHDKEIIDALDADLQKEAKNDPQVHLIAGINLGRWYWPFILNPVLGPGINQMFQSATGLNLFARDSFVPDISSEGENPPLWQDPQVPEHPWEDADIPPNPWMSKLTPSHAFEMKSPWEMAMEQGVCKVAGYPVPSTAESHQEWYDIAESMWEGLQELEGIGDKD